MNNEPVGYYYSNACFDIRDCSEQMKRNGVPLYTHSVKELTDEEIWELHQEYIDEVPCGHSMQTVGFIDFARAILRKAQENG
jgi:hypothetical protein